jgi:hypothetical protein
MIDDSLLIFELSLFTSNIKIFFCDVLDFFLSFKKKYEERKTHNMFSLMLNPQFKSLCLVSSFVGREKNIFIVEKYDQKSL